MLNSGASCFSLQTTAVPWESAGVPCSASIKLWTDSFKWTFHLPGTSNIWENGIWKYEEVNMSMESFSYITWKKEIGVKFLYHSSFSSLFCCTFTYAYSTCKYKYRIFIITGCKMLHIVAVFFYKYNKHNCRFSINL